MQCETILPAAGIECSVRVMPSLASILLVSLCLVCGVARAAEVQSHGLVFETWVRETFFQGYRSNDYTGKWDVPGEANHLADPDLAGLPVNPKAVKYGAPIGMGDALRQYDVDEPFILVVGCWVQSGPREKRFVKILAPRVEPEAWRKLWGPVTREDLERLVAVITDRTLTVEEARRRAQAMKSRPPFSESILVLNPKIDTKGQRRLQCSLRYADLIKHLVPGVDAGPEEVPTLWGRPFPQAVQSSPRTFGQGAAKEAGGRGDEGGPSSP